MGASTSSPAAERRRSAATAARDADLRSQRELTASSRAVVLQQLRLRVGDQLLDLGCGRGRVLLDALDLGATEVVGIDLNRGVERMLSAEMQRRGWVVTERTSLSDGVGYRLKRREKRATLRLMLGDLQHMGAPPPPIRFAGGLSSWSEAVCVFWYGAVMLPQVKRNVCSRVLSALPKNARLAYVHLPFGSLAGDPDRKTRDPLFAYGLDREWRLLRDSETFRADYLQTEAAASERGPEETASFLYVKGATLFPSSTRRESQAAQNATDARREQVLAERGRQSLSELRALQEGSAMAAEWRKGAIAGNPHLTSRLDASRNERETDEEDEDSEEGEAVDVDEDEDVDEDVDEEDESSASDYASDDEPPDADLAVRRQYRRLLRDRHVAVRQEPPHHGLDLADPTIGGQHRCYWCEQPAATQHKSHWVCPCDRSLRDRTRFSIADAQPWEGERHVIVQRSDKGWSYAILVWDWSGERPKLNLWFVRYSLGVKDLQRKGQRNVWNLLTEPEERDGSPTRGTTSTSRLGFQNEKKEELLKKA